MLAAKALQRSQMNQIQHLPVKSTLIMSPKILHLQSVQRKFKTEEDSDVNSSSGTSDAESSNFEDKDAERNKNNTLIQEFNAENKSTKVIDSFLDQQFKKSGIDTTNELGIMSEYTIRRLFRWMYKLNLQNKQLQQSIEELKSMLQRKSFKTSATVVPDLILPCANPDEVKRLDEKLQDKVVFADFVEFLSTKAAGNTALHIGYTLIGLIMTPYCGGYYTWDGLHKSTKKLAVKSHRNLHKTLEGEALCRPITLNQALSCMATKDVFLKLSS
ncbi:uncharacterized protein LOC113563101 [Ooceraea biroi]|uniref:uncharacterized protein LOC113563101 n=1 Tax=Ooceraea biroi TaxID=2015173 RepID=UPI000F08A158|nr:uncharacterized protein LOC113563101 [Ooceraea biroi]